MICPAMRRTLRKGQIMPRIDLPSLAMILAAQAAAATRIAVADRVDLTDLATALTALGAAVVPTTTGEWRIQGTGVGGWREPDRVLDLSGRPGAAPLLAGTLAVCDFTSVLAGDSGLTPALCRALEQLGARLHLRRGGLLPGAVTGTPWPLPALHQQLTAVEAAAMLLAGLNSPGRTGVAMMVDLEPAIDLMRRFGAHLRVQDNVTWVTGFADLTGADIVIRP